jgi:decaprenyl-phosphate phosphoribosyltransferase
MKTHIKDYVAIARPSHWFKNLFVIPGILLAYGFSPDGVQSNAWIMIIASVASVCLVASSNYVLNEILDAKTDRFHKEKQERPIPSGRVTIPVAYGEWIVLALVGLLLAWLASPGVFVSALLLWVMGCLYNIPPVRTKDKPYLDVLSESVNNPLRLAIGWFATGQTALPTLSVIMSYWMFGAFLMAIKRFGEYRHIDDADAAGSYRKSFQHYTQERLMVTVLFYASLFGMFSGVFMARYRIELVLATPLVALTMAYYIHLSYKPDSPVQYPERLYRERKLSMLVGLSAALCALLLFLDIPALDAFFAPR